jgi:hypothetical protein
MKRTDFQDTTRYWHAADVVFTDMQIGNAAGPACPTASAYVDRSTGHTYQVRHDADVVRVAPPALVHEGAPPYGPWLGLDP